MVIGIGAVMLFDRTYDSNRKLKVTPIETGIIVVFYLIILIASIVYSLKFSSTVNSSILLIVIALALIFANYRNRRGLWAFPIAI